MTLSDRRIWVNGELTSKVDATDRGLAYGDGLFETMLCVNGRVPLLEQHMQRLEASCERLSLPASPDAWKRDILQAIEQEDFQGRYVLKLMQTRGVGGRGYAPALQPRPTRVLIQLPYPDTGGGDGLRGTMLQTQLGSCRQLAGLKHLNRLEQVLAAQELAGTDCDEGLVRDANGFVIECVSANVLFVFDTRVVTPRLDTAGVAGVMRAYLMEAMAQRGQPVSQEYVHYEAALQADEIIVCNSVRGVRRMTTLDGRSLTERGVYEQLRHIAATVMSGATAPHGEQTT